MSKSKNCNLIYLAAAIVISITSGIFFPSLGMVVEPYLLLWLGALLFLNLLRLNTMELVSTFSRPWQLALSLVIKLVLLPLGLFFITHFVYEPLSLSVLLLAGISTGLGAPFVVNIIGGRLSLIVGMIISSSLLVPFVLPALVYLLFSTSISIPIIDMISLLVAGLFIPLAAGWLSKKYLPSAARFADKKSFELSLLFVILINFGMFSRFSEYFFNDPVFLVTTLSASFVLFGVFGTVGYFSVYYKSKSDRVTGLIALTYINNVLVAVFAGHFFGTQVAALAALYNIPYYTGIILLKKLLAHSR